MDKSELGDRMKLYEGREAKRTLIPLLPICIRLDGKKFSSFTRGLRRPYDERLSRLMIDVTRFLVQETGATIGYTQSDEISLILYSSRIKSETFLGGRVQKLTSILAAMATAKFNQLLGTRIPEKADKLALFDCRAWNVPNLEEAANTLLWRELDATKNSVSMLAQAHYSHKALMGQGTADKLKMLEEEKGVRWEDSPAFFKRGVFIQRHQVQRAFTSEEMEKLPERHEARRNPDLVVTRMEIRELEVPPFRKVQNRVGVVVRGEAPIVGL